MKASGHESPMEDFILGPWPVGLAWFAFAIITAGTARNAYRHLLCYSRPDLQQHVLRIIMVGPLYAFSAALCLSMTEGGCFFVRSVRDIWEAVVIYSFLTLIIEYMGGEHLCLHSISQREEAVPHLFPLNLCLRPIPTGSMIRLPKIGALQFVVVKPVVALISIVVYACGQYEDWYYQWSLFLVYNMSYSTALYALYLIYWASHDHPSLQAKRPLLKFISVKMIVFLTFWQALLLPHTPLPGNPSRWEDFILAVEMTIFGFLMNAAFSWQEFHSGMRAAKKSRDDSGPRVLKLDIPTTDMMGVDGSVRPEPPPTTDQRPPATIGHSQLVQNAKAAFCPRDIMLDATANFSRRYQQHVLIEDAQEYELHASDAHHDAEAGAAASEAGVTSDAASTGGTLFNFRARTYLIGRTLGFGAGAPGAEAARGGGDADATPCGGVEAITVGSQPPPPVLASAAIVDSMAPFWSVGAAAHPANGGGDAAWPGPGKEAAQLDALQDVPTLHNGFLEEGVVVGAGPGAPPRTTFEWPRFGDPPPSARPFAA